MAMSREQFEALVTRLESYARRKPAAYRLRVGLLAALGYAYIFLVLALTLTLLVLLLWLMIHGGTVWIKPVIVLVVLLSVIVRSLWVSIPPPEGIELRRDEAKPLFEMVDRLSDTLKAPRFHHLLVIPDFNAMAAQCPRLGIFGWQENYLLFGLPLMQALSPEQFQAVVAHELGHLSGNHGRFGGWIYRVSKTWNQLLENMQAHRGKDWLFTRFFRWYTPQFIAYSFTLRRMNEYEADRASAEVVGAKHASEALIQHVVRGRYLAETFWPHVYEQADRQENPTANAYSTMASTLQSREPIDDAAQWLDMALREKTGYADTHPALGERLTALGYLPIPTTEAQSLLPPLPEETAARYYLRDTLPNITTRLDRAWAEKVTKAWRDRYTQACEAQKQLAVLEEKAQRESLADKETWERARLTAEFRGAEAAIPLFREILAAHPNHLPAQFTLGKLLMDQNDETGKAYVDAVMQQEPESILEGCKAIYVYLKENGRSEEAEVYKERYIDYYEQLQTSQQERSDVSAGDKFLPHGLTPEQIEKLRAQLSRYALIRAAYLVRKQVTAFPEKPFYALVIAPRRAWYLPHSHEKDVALVKQLAKQLRLPGQNRILIPGPSNRKMGRVVRRVPGAEIYRA